MNKIICGLEPGVTRPKYPNGNRLGFGRWKIGTASRQYERICHHPTWNMKGGRKSHFERREQGKSEFA
jgi:hypothetical protein